MSSIRDGLGGEELQVSGLQAGGVNVSPYFTGSVTSESNFISDGKVLSSAGTGSPTTWGASVQAGQFVTSAGSTVVINFGTVYSSAPFVTVSPFGSATGDFFVTGTSAGSATVVTAVAAVSGTWNAVGTL